MPSPPSGSRREDYDGKDVCTEGGSDGRIDSGTRGIVTRHTRTIFAALIKIAYFINQEELERVGETGKERVSVRFDKIFGAELFRCFAVEPCDCVMCNKIFPLPARLL